MAMTTAGPGDAAEPAHGETTDVGAYCRAIEAHLCVRNGGHRIRVIGPAFDLARAWHRAGIPLKVVERGIDLRVERAEARGVRRPLRLEYCETDVQRAYADWRRAVGPMAAPGGQGGATDEAPAERYAAHQQRDQLATCRDRDRCGRHAAPPRVGPELLLTLELPPVPPIRRQARSPAAGRPARGCCQGYGHARRSSQGHCLPRA